MYRQLWSNKNAVKLICANGINRFGDSIDAIAFTWLTYRETQSASLSALVLAANILPTVLFQPLAAPLIDAMKKQRVMMMTDLLRGCLLIGFICLFAMKLLQGWMFLVFTFVINSVEAFRVPAGVSFYPQLLTKEEIERGMSLNQVTSQASTLIGTAVGGALVAIAPALAMAVDAVTFFLSALLLAWIRTKEVINEQLIKASYLDNLKQGFRYIAKNQMFLILVTGMLLFNMIASIPSALCAPYISTILHKDAGYLSIMDIVQTLAMLLTIYLYPKLSQRIKPKTIFVYLGFGSQVALLAMMLFTATLQDSMLLMSWLLIGVVMGCGAGLFSNFISITFVKVVEQDYLSRSSALINSVGCCASPIAAILCAILVNYFTILKVLSIGLGFAVLALLLLLFVTRTLHE